MLRLRPATCRRVRSGSAGWSPRARSGRTSARRTTSSASTTGPTRSPAPPRSACWGKRNHPGERAARSREHSVQGVIVGDVRERNYRLIVEGELGDKLERVFPGMTLTPVAGNAALTDTSATRPSSRHSWSACPTSGSPCSTPEPSTMVANARAELDRATRTGDEAHVDRVDAGSVAGPGQRPLGAGPRPFRRLGR